MAYLCCSKHEKYSNKNDNVGKKAFTLLPNISNFMKMLKNIINTSKKIYIRKPLEKF